MGRVKLKLITLKCAKCGHAWAPRRPVMPKICPVCKRENYAKDGHG